MVIGETLRCLRWLKTGWKGQKRMLVRGGRYGTNGLRSSRMGKQRPVGPAVVCCPNSKMRQAPMCAFERSTDGGAGWTSGWFGATQREYDWDHQHRAVDRWQWLQLLKEICARHEALRHVGQSRRAAGP